MHRTLGKKCRGADSVIPRLSNIILLYGCHISYCGLKDQVTGGNKVYKLLPTPFFFFFNFPVLQVQHIAAHLLHVGADTGKAP